MTDQDTPRREEPARNTGVESETPSPTNRLGHDTGTGPARDGGSGLTADDPAAEEEVGGGD